MKMTYSAGLSLVALLANSSVAMAGTMCLPVKLEAAPVPVWSDASLAIMGAIISLAAYRLLRKRL